MSEATVPLNGLSSSRHVASLDIETLALSNHAVVTEVGIIEADIGQAHDGSVGLSIRTQHYFQFNALDQIARGRVLDPKTWVFHLRLCGVKGIHEQVADGLLLDEAACQSNLARIQQVLNSVSEIWINGCSFDPVILSTLAQDYEFKTQFAMDRLWSHSKERDVRTINKTIPSLLPEKTKASHRALGDARWNLDIARAYYNLLSRLSSTKPEQNVPADSRPGPNNIAGLNPYAGLPQ
jgi:hypothetical protein